MITLPFKNQKDFKPTFLLNDLYESPIFGDSDKTWYEGDKLTLKLTNSGGITAPIDFVVLDDITAKATGWNDYLFPMPKSFRPVELKICEVVGLVEVAVAAADEDSWVDKEDDESEEDSWGDNEKAPTSWKAPISPTSSKPSKYLSPSIDELSFSELKALVSSSGSATAAAAELGCHPDTVRRRLKKFEAEAKVSKLKTTPVKLAPKVSAPKAAPVTVKASKGKLSYQEARIKFGTDAKAAAYFGIGTDAFRYRWKKERFG